MLYCIVLYCIVFQSMLLQRRSESIEKLEKGFGKDEVDSCKFIHVFSVLIIKIKIAFRTKIYFEKANKNFDKI